jgi:hypothetical protein
MSESVTTNAELQAAAALIRRDFEWDNDAGAPTEDELFELLSNHIAWLIEHRLEWLLSLMYRMDIDEARVSAALHPLAAEPANIGLARLVLERQRQRAQTKRDYQPPKLDDDMADLAW